MKRILIKYSLLLCLVVLAGNIKGQYYYFDRGLVEVNVGVAIPFFNFGDQHGIESAHYAKTGFNAGGSVAYFYSKHVAMEFNLNYNIHGVNTNKLADAYYQTDTINNIAAAVTVGSFHDFSGAVGFRFDLPVSEQFSFVFKMMSGLRGVHKPGATINLVTISGPSRIIETSDTQVKFAFYSAFGGRVKITEKLGVHVMVSYIGSNLNFEFTKNKVPVVTNEHLGVIMVNADVGLSF